MKNTTRTVVVSAITISTWLILFYLYPQFPQIVPTHWNITGNVDQYGNKTSLFLFPILISILALLFHFFPSFIKKESREKIEQSISSWNIMQCIIFGFFAYIYGVILYASLYPKSSFSILFLFGFWVFFIFLGNYLGKLRQNHLIGIRVPPVFRSEEIWNKTHRFWGWLYVMTGISMLTSALLRFYHPYFFFFLFIISTVSPIFYAYYLEYQHKKVR